MTTHTQKDLGTIQAILNRLNNERLPRALSLQQKVAAGGLLDDMDHEFIKLAMADAGSLKTLVDRNPEYQQLAQSMADLYRAITAKGLENAQKTTGKK